MFHVKHGKDGIMTIRDLYLYCSNVTSKKVMQITNGTSFDDLTVEECMEKYGDCEISGFGVYGKVITVLLKEEENK